MAYLSPQQAFVTFDLDTQNEIDRIAKCIFDRTKDTSPQGLAKMTVDYNAFAGMLSDRRFNHIFHEYCIHQAKNNIDFILEVLAFRIRVAAVWMLGVETVPHSVEMFRSEGLRMIVFC